MKGLLYLISIFYLAAAFAAHGKEYTLQNGTRFKVADSIKKTDAIRGYITHLYDDPHIIALAQKCHLIQFLDGAGKGKYVRSESELQETAELTGHPEVVHARAILHGVSAQGGLATEEMWKKPDKVIAVIYLHNAHRKNANGVPICYVAASGEGFYPNAIWHHDTISAWRKTGESTFGSIVVHSSKHASNGPQDYIALWLEEVIKLRMPDNIPRDGSPYEMNKVGESVGYIGDCDAIEIPKGHDDRWFGSQRFINAKVWAYDKYPGGGKNNGDSWFPSKRAAEAWAYYSNNLKMPPPGAVFVSNNRIRNSSTAKMHIAKNSRIAEIQYGLNGRAVKPGIQSQNVFIIPVKPDDYIKTVPVLIRRNGSGDIAQ